MGFWTFGNIRTLLDTETDHDSPGSEELVSQIRENIEALFMSLLDTGISGTATADPSNDANGYFYDTASAWTNDLHNGRTLLITSGSAKGNMYTIDDTVDSTGRLDCTGDNLYADGVRSGDSYKILYDLLVNTDGHDHDGVNSPAPVLADNYIDNTKLHTATSSATGALTANTPVSITMHDYSFFPSIQGTGTGTFTLGVVAAGGDTVGRFSITSTANDAYAVYWRYVTATDEPFVYAIRDKTTGELVHVWAGDDPPPGYWGLSETPEGFVPPIVVDEQNETSGLDKEKYEEIICWKVPRDVFQELMQEMQKEKTQACKTIKEKFDLDCSGKITLKTSR
jgi:hypothetical protein